MEGDADGAVFSFSDAGVGVCDLSERQKQQQKQAQDGGKSARPGGAVPAVLECGQTFVPRSNQNIQLSIP